MSLLITIIVFAAVFLIAGIPLHLAAKLLGGESSILKAAAVNLLVGILTGIAYVFLSWGAIAAFILCIAAYKLAFKIGWIRAILVWALQAVISFLLLMLALFIGVLAL